jgi:hypothetical protein
MPRIVLAVKATFEGKAKKKKTEEEANKRRKEG